MTSGISLMVALMLSAGGGRDGGVGAPAHTARAQLKDAKGQSVGEVTLEETPAGLLLTGSVHHLPAGVHALHVHEVGKCDAPFKSAGGHYNPLGHQHGARADSTRSLNPMVALR